MNRWHTSKTQPNVSKEFTILVIWKNKDITIEMPNLDEWNNLYLENIGNWHVVKEEIQYWQYTDKLFKNELKQL